MLDRVEELERIGVDTRAYFVARQIDYEWERMCIMSGWTSILLSLMAAIMILAATTIIWVAQTSTSPLLPRPTNLNQALEYLKSARGGPGETADRSVLPVADRRRERLCPVARPPFRG